MPRNESAEVFKALHGAPPSPFNSSLNNNNNNNKRLPAAIIDNNGLPAQELLKAAMQQRGGANPYADPYAYPEAAMSPNPPLGGRWGAVPPLQADPRLMMAGPPGALLPPPQLPLEQQQREGLASQPSRVQLEPINIALAGAAGRTSALEDRVVQLEHRLLTAERTAAEVRFALPHCRPSSREGCTGQCRSMRH